MDSTSAAEILSNLNAPDLWMKKCPTMEKERRAEVFVLAGKMWLEKLARQKQLLIHPSILKELEAQSWVANDLQRKMIWASVLATQEGADSKKRFKEIKIYLLTKYGREWWEDVYLRKNGSYAVKEWIRKRVGSYGTAVSTLVENTILFGSMAEEERNKALSSLPEV
jgi:hypothetical protein